MSILNAGGITNHKTQRAKPVLFDETEHLQKFGEAVRRLSQSHHVKMKRTAKVRSPRDCRQAIFSPSGETYCGLLKEQVNKEACRWCALFDAEPPEYKLFIRI